MFAIDVYKDQDAPAFALLAVTLRKYGFGIIDDEPEFLRQQIEQDYDIKLTDKQSDKLQAALVVLSTDWFEHDWRVFEVCCHLFSNQYADHELFDPLEVEQAVIGIAEATLIKESILNDGESLEYGDEVRAYLGKLFYDYGFHSAPKICKMAIMPPSAKHSDKQHNEAVKEIFDTHLEAILEYLEKID